VAVEERLMAELRAGLGLAGVASCATGSARDRDGAAGAGASGVAGAAV
jgi:hypothetical protein